MPTANATAAVSRFAYRTGSIHSFAPGMPGPSLAARRAAPPIPEPGVPVEAIDAGTLSHLGGGKLVSAHLDGLHLMGTIEWPEDVEAMALADPDGPRAHCRFAEDGSIRKVWVEITRYGCDCLDCKCEG